ncbi:fatty-acyl coenzyme A oxidase [Maudiozyma exigua]|uniref:Acyl-coenzyme A oxidase n=1 Tax=Maudiozyma exigua TaxID=34358 RepID=A0A9P6VS47_MAUEX|nr:fatty-acyl coenzyme A oxidase [Kazachstania exigua]
MTKLSTNDKNNPVFNPKNFIQSERASSKIQIDQINTFLESNPERRSLTHRLIQEITNDRTLETDTSYYDLTKTQQREITAKKISRLSLYMEHDIKTSRNNFDKNLIQNLQKNNNTEPILTTQDFAIFDKRLSLIANIDPQLSTRVGVHLGLFGNCIKGNGTNEQITYWLQERGASMIRGIYGCFAMTELGHGSNVAQLQTTATFNDTNNTFIINTPNLTATKWWIGGAAHSATHIVCYARLIVQGKDYGVKTFVVQLRDLKTFQLCPGIVIGDIGTKMGRDGIDNGWIQFNNVVIPKENMLCRFVQVENNGNGSVKVNIQPQLDQISGYSALLSGRVNMVMDSFRFGSKFATIATRYAVGRQQFAPANDQLGKQEVQLMDYPLHQYRIIPQIALVYLIAPISFKLMDTYYDTLNELYRVSTAKDEKALLTVSAKLKNLFISSASLKATNTWFVAQLIDELRQTCGGHGYSQYNGFGKGYNDWVVQCTWEGDNTVLSLSSAKSILKKFGDAAQKGKFNEKLDGDQFGYLDPNFIAEVYTNQVTANIEDDSDLTNFIQVWSIILVKSLIHIGKALKKNNNDIDSLSKLLVQISKFRAIYLMLKTYHEKLSNENESHITDATTKETMWNIFRLFSVYYIDKYSGEFLQMKLFKADDISNVIQPKLFKLMAILRTDCVALVDAFELPDNMLNAPIGFFDGDIYHNYFNEVTKNNPQETDGAGIPPYYNALTSMLSRD